jgi:hypothetical protein
MNGRNFKAQEAPAAIFSVVNMRERARWMTIAVATLLGTAVGAHEGHSHVVGTVAGSHADHLVVQAEDGRMVSVLLDPNTRYRAAGVSSSRNDVRTGDRIVVEVREVEDGLLASEVSYSPEASAMSLGAAPEGR